MWLRGSQCVTLTPSEDSLMDGAEYDKETTNIKQRNVNTAIFCTVCVSTCAVPALSILCSIIVARVRLWIPNVNWDRVDSRAEKMEETSKCGVCGGEDLVIIPCCMKTGQLASYSEIWRHKQLEISHQHNCISTQNTRHSHHTCLIHHNPQWSMGQIIILHPDNAEIVQLDCLSPSSSIISIRMLAETDPRVASFVMLTAPLVSSDTNCDTRGEGDHWPRDRGLTSSASVTSLRQEVGWHQAGELFTWRPGGSKQCSQLLEINDHL